MSGEHETYMATRDSEIDLYYSQNNSVNTCIHNIEIDCRKQTVTIVMLHCDLCKISRSLWVSIRSLHVHPLNSKIQQYTYIVKSQHTTPCMHAYLGASTGLVERGCRVSLAEICVLHDANLDSNAYNNTHIITIMTMSNSG